MEFNHYRNGIYHDYKRCATTFKRQYLYNINKTGDNGNTYAWNKGVAMGVELELLLISTKYF